MTQVWVDPFSGLSGDLWLGAWLALGATEAELRAVLRRFPFEDLDLRVEPVLRCGIAATKASVMIGGKPDEGASTSHIVVPTPGAKKVVRRRIHGAHGLTWKEVDELLARHLEGRVQEVARGAFHALAAAEARVHGMDLDHVHFHEVGLKDSIADVSLAAAGWALLGEPVVHVGPIATGTGHVRINHGHYPLPAPATAYLLEGFEQVPGVAPVDHELTTPTGAALAAQLATHRRAPARFIPERVAYAAGGWDFPGTPNVLRLSLGRFPQEGAGLVQVETNVDDATPQQVAFAQERLLEAGAVDVWVSPATFKKGRSGWIVSALVPAARLEAVQQRLAAELPTLGVRSWPVQRTEADRRFLEARVEGARVPVKEGIWPHGSTRQPEYEDAARAARDLDQPLRSVQDAALRNAEDK